MENSSFAEYKFINVKSVSAVVPKAIYIAKIPTHLLTPDILHSAIYRAVKNQEKKIILHTNAYLVTLAHTTDPWLIDYFQEKADFVMCDGAGIQLAARFTNQIIPQKIAFNIWFWDFAKLCVINKYSIFLLGAKEGVAAKAAQNLSKKNPSLQVYHHHGYFNKKSDSKENAEVIQYINNLKPNILLVAFGMPIQEAWIKENSDKLNTNIIFSCGGALDFFSGNAKVAPVILRKLYLEWIFRLYHDPKRLWKRYLIGNIKFIFYVLKNR